MEKFIGRYYEISNIERELKKSGRSLISIVGRRGVGKTTLIKKALEQNNLLDDFTLIEIEGKKNKPNKEQVRETFLIFSRKLKFSKKDMDFFYQYPSWATLFSIANDYIKKQKVVLVIDEFAWFDVKGSYFLEDFGSFYNQNILSQLKVIVSASAISWMNKKLIKNTGSLFHKVSLSIKLKPFTLHETIEFLKCHSFNLTPSIVIKYYTMTGGVVRYLEKCNPLKSFEENAVEIFKNNTNISGLEYDEIFNQTFSSNSLAHQKIIDAFQHRKSFNIQSIIKTTGLSKATVLTTLDELVVSDILTIQKNYKNKSRERFYFLTDLFCLSYLKIVKDNILRPSIFEDHTFSIKFGLLFEAVALLNVDLIKRKLGRNNIETIEYAWRNDESQIDLIIEYSDKKYSIVECKFKDSIFKIDDKYQQNLINKKNNFINYLNQRKINNPQIDFVLFSMYGAELSKPDDKRIGFVFHNVFLNQELQYLI